MATNSTDTPLTHVWHNRLNVFNQIKNWLVDLWSITKLCRASVLVLAIGAAFLVLVPQGRDVVLALAEHPLRARWGLLVAFFVAAGFWALNIWYWARVMLRFEWAVPSRGDGMSGRARLIRAHLPRLFGTLAFLAVANGFCRAAMDTTGLTRTGHWILAGSSVVLAVVFYCSVVIRKPVSRTVRRQVEKIGLRSARRPQVGRDAGPPAPPISGDGYEDILTSLRELSRAALVALATLGTVTFAMFLAFSWNPAWARPIGSAPILLLATAAWVPVGAILVYVSYRLKLPLTLLVFASLVVFSFVNDNHAVRTLDEGNTPRAESVADHFASWLDARGISALNPEEPEGEVGMPAPPPYPVVVVAAEGGGIRAAYWTATLLAKLQDDFAQSGMEGTFANHVYAISGVSGGSLGGAVFSALVKEQLHGREFRCDDVENKGQVEECAHQMLEKDFLSPTLAALLYPDLVQRFLPFPVAHFDRARAMEKSWEKAWNRLGFENRQFGGPDDGLAFDDLWEGEHSGKKDLYQVPLLFLNSTWVETGKRVLISPIRIQDGEFVDSVDFFEVIDRDVRLSSAVHNSARFTYVSPAGTVKTPDGKTWGHLVDGGYFENSGTATALEVLVAMERGAGDRWSQIRPVVLVISNDPALGAEQKPQKLLTEVLAPAVALLETRGARGSYSLEALRDHVCPSSTRSEGPTCEEFVELDLKGVEGVPLGWVLSGEARRQMNDALQGKFEKTLNTLRARAISDDS